MKIVALWVALASSLIYLLCLNYYQNYSVLEGWKLGNGRLVGGDFLTFYLAGQEVCNGEISRLYDWDYNHKRQQELLEPQGINEGALPFVYPPLVAFAFGGFCHLGLIEAYLTWVAISIFLFAGSMLLVVKAMGGTKTDIVAALFIGLAFYPFSLECLGAGQTSAIGMAICAGMFYCLRTDREFWAGCILSLSYYKPPIFLFFLLVQVCCWRKKILLGFLVGAIPLIILSLLMMGWHGLINYFKIASSYRYGEDLVAGTALTIDKGVGLLATLTELLPLDAWILQLMLAGIILCSLVGLRFLRQNSLPLEMTISLYLSLQMVVYDLSILLIPLVVLALSKLNRAQNLLFHLVALGFFLEFSFRTVEIGDIRIRAAGLLSLGLISLLLTSRSES